MTPADEDRTAATALERYETLRDTAQRALEVGDLDRALDLYDEALACAEQCDDHRLADLALCNRAAVAIELRCADTGLASLRAILVRNGDPVACRLAAYNLARAHELARDYKKALFYAQIAAQRSDSLGRPDWVASSHNQLGNLKLAQSQVDDACAAYELALSHMPADDDVWRARILDNLGYCWVVRGRVRDGLRLLYTSLRLLRRHKALRYQVSTRLDLCFAHLEAGRLEHARRHGLAAWDLAERFGDVESSKNALCLLGQTESLAGDRDAARAYFETLERHYPGTPGMTDLLLALDVRKILNLKA